MTDPGWRPLQAVTADQLAIVELVHESGHRAEWFFDGAGQHSKDMAFWSADAYDALRASFCPCIEALRDAFLFKAPAALDVTRLVAVQEFMRLGPALRAAIASKLQDEVLPEASHIATDASDEAPPSWADPAALHRTLSVNLQNRLIEAMQTGAFTWPSPTGGPDMRCTGSFALGDFNVVFCFYDERSGLNMLLLATEQVCRIAGLYVPHYGKIITQNNDQSWMLQHHLGGFCQNLMRHLAFYADALLANSLSNRPRHEFAAFLRGGSSVHLCHQFWNELTGIDVLTAALPQHRLPVWLIPSLPGHEIELYGPIDVLFPEISGRTRRGFVDQDAIIRHAYAHGLILFRATGGHISDRLRTRVMAHAVSNAPKLPTTKRAFLIGLRVENRTVVDLGAFCSLVIEEAIRLHPGCTIVFDGHNARGNTRSDQTLTSHREDSVSHSPIAVERSIVEAMRTRFAGQPVTLLDTLGDPLSTSLAWSQACNGFIAIWGAGLTKYRMVANKPGLTVTNCWNLQNKGDLHLYDSAAYMENPTPLVFVPGALIQDMASAPTLIPFGHPSYSNFSYDEQAMRSCLHAFFKALDGSPDALAALAAPPRRRLGSVDMVDTTVRGWAFYSDQSPTLLDILIDGNVIGRVACDMPRPDLLAAGLGTTMAGFDFAIPQIFLDGARHELQVRFTDGIGLPMLSPNTPNPFAFRLGGAPPAPG